MNATPATSNALKRSARAAISKRFLRSGRDELGAIAGFGVGKRAKQIKKAMAKRKKRFAAGDYSEHGVGISAANIHWAVLGTKARRTESGKPTGKMAAVFAGVTAKAEAASRGPAGAAAVAKMKQRLEIEARKKA